jgi:spore maturation protein CgeB
MRLFIVGPKWVGDWTEGMGRAAEARGHIVNLFYYHSDNLSGLKNMAYRRFPSALHAVLRLAENRFKASKAVLMNYRLIAAVRAFQPDVIIILKGEAISRDTMLTLRSLNIPLASWWVDNPLFFPGIVGQMELFDMVYVFDKECITDLEVRGIKNVMYLPCACDHTRYYPQTLDPLDYPDLRCTIGLIATYYPERATLLSHMKGLNVGLWGGRWDNSSIIREFPRNTWRSKRITPDDANKVYNLAMICPNIHHSQTRYGGLNTRTFEILAAGGFEIVDDVPGLGEHFNVGDEIVTYSSAEHFRELIEYYLNHPHERAAITERGRARVLRDHTYEKRLEVILGDLTSGVQRHEARNIPTAYK